MALQPPINQTDINTTALPFYKALAQCLFNNTHQYRAQNYRDYPPVGVSTGN